VDTPAFGSLVLGRRRDVALPALYPRCNDCPQWRMRMSGQRVGTEEVSEEELRAPFLGVLRYAGEWAQTDADRDAVMNALFDVLVGVGDHDGEPF
jgi:hypothetical protein